MECRRGLAMRILSVRPSVRPSVCLSVCPSVRLSNACIVIKRKKDMSKFLYQSSTFGQKLRTLQRGLFAIAELHVVYITLSGLFYLHGHLLRDF